MRLDRMVKATVDALEDIKGRDIVVIDVAARKLDVEVADGVIAERMAAWRPPAPRYTTGVFAKYVRLVSSASQGAVTG